MIRLTKDVVQKLLIENEGFKKTVHDKIYNESRHYLIQGGKLFIRMTGKQPFSGHYNTTVEATADQVRNFLRKYVLDKK